MKLIKYRAHFITNFLSHLPRAVGVEPAQGGCRVSGSCPEMDSLRGAVEYISTFDWPFFCNFCDLVFSFLLLLWKRPCKCFFDVIDLNLALLCKGRNFLCRTVDAV